MSVPANNIFDQPTTEFPSLSPSLSSHTTKALVGEELNDAQLMSFIFLVCGSSLLSIFGSARVWQLQRQTQREGNRNADHNRHSKTVSTTYHRLMRSLSIADLIFSIACFSQPFLGNADRTVVPSAIGTKLTCGISGFIFVWANLVGILQNTILSVHFWLVIVRGWTNDDLQKSFERPAQAVAWLWSLVTPAVAFSRDYEGPQYVSMVCSMGAAPIAFWLYYSTTIMSVSLAMVGTVWVYVVYRRKMNVTLRRSIVNHNASGDLGGGVTNTRTNSDTLPSRRLQTLARRSVAYTCVYLNTILWPLLLGIFTVNTDLDNNANGDGPVYVIRVLTWIFFPMQGFLNLLIYVQPLVDRKYKAASGHTTGHVSHSKLQVYLQIIVLGDLTQTGPLQRSATASGSISSSRQFRTSNWSISSSLRALLFLEKETKGSNNELPEDSFKHDGPDAEKDFH